MGKCCRTCRFYDLPRVMNAAGRVQGGRVARCLWTFTAPLPDSITTGATKPMFHPRYMAPDEGETCPTWEGRE